MAVRSFTIFKEYYDLISLLPKEEQKELILSIFEYMFEDKEPTLNDRQNKIFINLKRPLNISKRNSERSKGNGAPKGNNNALKTNQTSSKKQTKQVQKNKQEEFKKTNTSNDVYVYVNVNVNVLIKEIIDYLNIKTNKNFKYNSNNTVKHIKARLNEGYTLDDFKKVIDTKCLEWLNDKKMNQYLRPDTLFGTKFESYLNQQQRKITTKDIAPMMNIEEFMSKGVRK